MSRNGRGRVAVLVAVGCAAIAPHAEAADVRLVMQTNTMSPIADYRYTDVGYVTLGETGDVGFISRVRKDNDEKRVVFRESTATIAPLAIPGEARPFGGTWAVPDVEPMQFRGPWLFWMTGDPSLGPAVFARGSLANSTQPILAGTDVAGATTVGSFAKYSANQNRMLVTVGGNAIYAVHPNSGLTRLIGTSDPIPGRAGAFATFLVSAFVDNMDRVTCAVPGTPGPNPGSGNYVLHGPIGGLQPLAWFEQNPTASLEQVGVDGSIVARSTNAMSGVTTMYVGAPGSPLTQAFQFGTGLTLVGASISVVEKVRPISATAFAFLARESNGVTKHVMVYENSVVKDLSKPGDDAPGTGQKFFDGAELGANSKGQVVFRGNYTPGSTGIFLYTPGAPTELILGKGGKVGSIDVGSVGDIDNASIDENGRVGFTVTHATQNVVGLVVTGQPGKPQSGADLALTAEQKDGKIVFRVTNNGPDEAKGGTLTLSRVVLKRADQLQFGECNDVGGDTVCDLFRAFPALAPGASTELAFLPPDAGTRVDGYVIGPSDPNDANNRASVTYEPQASNFDETVDDSCSLRPSRSTRGAASGLLVGLVALLALRRRR